MSGALSAKSDAGMAERCMRSAETSDVISAAEEPNPVLWTDERVTPVGANGGIWAREDMRGLSPSSFN